MTTKSADVVVVGGGVNGASIAMHLARMGAGRVLLLEKGHLASGASGRSGAMVRQHYLHPVLVRMARRGPPVFPNFADAAFRWTARSARRTRSSLSPEHEPYAPAPTSPRTGDEGANTASSPRRGPRDSPGTRSTASQSPLSTDGNRHATASATT